MNSKNNQTMNKTTSTIYAKITNVLSIIFIGLLISISLILLISIVIFDYGLIGSFGALLVSSALIWSIANIKSHKIIKTTLIVAPISSFIFVIENAMYYHILPSPVSWSLLPYLLSIGLFLSICSIIYLLVTGRPRMYLMSLIIGCLAASFMFMLVIGALIDRY